MKKRTKREAAAHFKFLPFSTKQKKLLTWWTPKSPYRDYDMVIADGAVRSGKTVGEIDSFMMWSLSTFENQTFIMAGKSMGALKRNVLNPLFKILTAKGIRYRYIRTEDPRLEVGTNIYYLFGANNEKSQDVLAGLTAAGAYADEIALFPQSFVEQMVARCSVDGAKVFANCNPQGPYHWFKTEYIDKAKEKRILYLHFTMDDNLSLSERVKERYRRMFSGLFFKRYILGLWVSAEGIIYDMWDDHANTFDDDDLVPGFKMLARRYISIDYGTSNPMVFLDIWDDGDTCWVLNEYYYDSRKAGAQKEDSQYADDFEAFVGTDEFPIYTVLDPSAASFKVALRNRGYRVKDADNDVEDGIRMVSTMMQKRKLRVHRRNCPNFLKERASYIWDEKAGQRGEEKPVKQMDHAMDDVRYFVKTIIKPRRLEA